MKATTFTSAFALVAAGILVSGAAEARDQIRIVGSSTVYPFTTAVAEQLGKTAGVKTPVVESTGTGGGMKLFCAGIGANHPDATNASRRMKKSEFDDCQKNGVKDIVEINIGFDGLTVAQSKQGTPIKLTLAQLLLAVAKEVPGPDGKLVANPNKNWSDIDKSLPNIEDRGPRAAADLRHARLVPRTAAGEGRGADPGPRGAQEVRRARRSRRRGRRCARTAPMSRRARTTT